MKQMKKTASLVLVVGLAAGVFAAVPAAADPGTRKAVVQYERFGDPVKRIGHWHDPWTYTGMIEAFKAPKRMWETPTSLTVKYTGRYAATFYLESQAGVIAPEGDWDQFRVQRARLVGKGWVTNKGIRVGSSMKKVRNRYRKLLLWRGPSFLNQTQKVWKVDRTEDFQKRDGWISTTELVVKKRKVKEIRLAIGGVGE